MSLCSREQVCNTALGGATRLRNDTISTSSEPVINFDESSDEDVKQQQLLLVEEVGPRGRFRLLAMAKEIFNVAINVPDSSTCTSTDHEHVRQTQSIAIAARRRERNVRIRNMYLCFYRWVKLIMNV